MSSLFLVRHGQASFLSDDYDQLSPLGEAQAHALGQHWVTLGIKCDHVYTGPRRRHLQTEAAVASVYHMRGLPWPDRKLLPELDEHQGPEIMQCVLPDLVEENQLIQELVDKLEDIENRQQRDYFKLFQHVMRLWVRDEIKVEGSESWSMFETRVRSGLEKIMDADRGGETSVAFTSGGPVATVAGLALDLPAERTMELSWIVRNAAYAEFRFSGGRFSLSAFNGIPHFQKPELLTYV